MTLLLNPILEALEVARQAAGGAVRTDDEVTVEDREGQLVFMFLPLGDVLGSGVRVTINKSDSRVLGVVHEQ